MSKIYAFPISFDTYCQPPHIFMSVLQYCFLLLPIYNFSSTSLLLSCHISVVFLSIFIPIIFLHTITICWHFLLHCHHQRLIDFNLFSSRELLTPNFSSPTTVSFLILSIFLYFITVACTLLISTSILIY